MACKQSATNNLHSNQANLSLQFYLRPFLQKHLGSNELIFRAKSETQNQPRLKACSRSHVVLACTWKRIFVLNESSFYPNGTILGQTSDSCRVAFRALSMWYIRKDDKKDDWENVR